MSVFEFGPFRLDAVERALFEGGNTVPLTDKVFELLLLLVENHGRVVSKLELMRSLWPDTVVEENNLTVNMSVLRKALGERPGERRYIETLARRGYRFIADVRAVADVRAPAGGPPPLLSPQAAAPPVDAQAPFASLAPATFVGRQGELARLGERLASARSGRGRLVFITGEPGLGKTELCEQFLLQVQQQRQPAFIARGRCLEQVGVAEAYLPFLEAFRALGALQDGAGASVLPILRQHAPTWCAELGMQAAGGEARATASGGSTARMVRELGDALEALGTAAPVVVLLEDMHWGDPSSCDMLRFIGQRVARWRALVLATFRDAELELDNHPLRNVRRELAAHDQCEELGLALLDRAAIAHYLDARLPSTDGLPSELTDLIARTTEGHPLFVTRLVQLLMDRGDIRQVGERVELARPVSELEVGIPQSVRGLIEKKLELLDAEATRALQYASVIGVELSSALLARLLGLDEVVVDERLDQLARAHRLLEALGEERLPSGRLTQRYRFAHVLYSNVLYAGLASKRRMLLHEQVAQALLAEHGKEARHVAAQLALHFEAARDFEAAVEQLLAAADNVGRVLANREARQYYERARELLPELPPDAQVPLGIILHYNLAWSSFKVGDGERAITYAENLLTLSSAPEFAGDGEAAERARQRVFEYLGLPWRDAFGMKDVPRMPDQDPSMGAAAVQCEADAILCYLLFHTGRPEQMGARAEHFLALAQATHNEPRRAEALGWLAANALESSNLAEATRYLEQGLPAARAIGYERALILLCSTQARVHQRRGEYAEAEALHREGLSFTFEVAGRVDYLTQTALCQAHLGRLAEALSALAEARDIAGRSSELTQELQAITSFVGWAYLEAGESERARVESRQAAALAEAAGRQAALILALLQLARVHTERGELGEARAALARARELGAGAAEATARDGYRRARRDLAFASASGELQLAEGRLEDASRSAARALELAASFDAPKHLALARGLAARVQLAAAEPRGARAEALAGLEVLRGRPVPIVAWRLLLTLGSACRRLGDDAAAAAAFAEGRALCEQIGAGLDGQPLLAAWARAAAP